MYSNTPLYPLSRGEGVSVLKQFHLSRQFIEDVRIALAVVRIFDDGFFGFFFGRFRFFREAKRFHFMNLVHGEGGDSLALGLVALHADELFHIDVEGFAEDVVSSEGHADARIHHIGEQDELALLVLAQEAQLLVRRVEKINWIEVEKLEDLIESERGFGGYGSTGK